MFSKTNCFKIKSVKNDFVKLVQELFRCEGKHWAFSPVIGCDSVFHDGLTHFNEVRFNTSHNQ